MLTSTSTVAQLFTEWFTDVEPSLDATMSWDWSDHELAQTQRDVIAKLGGQMRRVRASACTTKLKIMTEPEETDQDEHPRKAFRLRTG